MEKFCPARNSVRFFRKAAASVLIFFLLAESNCRRKKSTVMPPEIGKLARKIFCGNVVRNKYVEKSTLFSFIGLSNKRKREWAICAPLDKLFFHTYIRFVRLHTGMDGMDGMGAIRRFGYANANVFGRSFGCRRRRARYARSYQPHKFGSFLCGVIHTGDTAMCVWGGGRGGNGYIYIVRFAHHRRRSPHTNTIVIHFKRMYVPSLVQLSYLVSAVGRFSVRPTKVSVLMDFSQKFD